MKVISKIKKISCLEFKIKCIFFICTKCFKINFCFSTTISNNLQIFFNLKSPGEHVYFWPNKYLSILNSTSFFNI